MAKEGQDKRAHAENQRFSGTLKTRGFFGVQRGGSSEIDLVIENSVALQKVVTELAMNLKKLSSDTSEMLNLFKEATRTMASEKAEEEIGKSDIDELKSKVDELIEQNKIIAKGILLLESSLKPKGYSSY